MPNICLFLYKQLAKYLRHQINVTIMKQRLVYIDVLRGICIFVVAYTHFVQFCINDAPKTGIHQFLTLLFLQMFFFISGFVGYKDSEKWSLSEFKVFLLKKINTLFIPTICSMSLYQVVTKGSLDALWNLGGDISRSVERRLLVYRCSIFNRDSVWRYHGSNVSL